MNTRGRSLRAAIKIGPTEGQEGSQNMGPEYGHQRQQHQYITLDDSLAALKEQLAAWEEENLYTGNINQPWLHGDSTDTSLFGTSL